MYNAYLTEIMQAIYERVPPLPEAYILEIESGFDLVSQLDLLRADVAATRHLVDILTNDIKRTYQMDMEDGEDVLDDYKSFLESINTLQGRYDLAALYLQTGEYGLMENILNGIPNEFELNDMQLEDLGNWQTYFGIAAGLKQSGVYPNALSLEQIELIGKNIPEGQNCLQKAHGKIPLWYLVNLCGLSG